MVKGWSGIGVIATYRGSWFRLGCGGWRVSGCLVGWKGKVGSEMRGIGAGKKERWKGSFGFWKRWVMGPKMDFVLIDYVMLYYVIYGCGCDFAQVYVCLLWYGMYGMA